MYITHLSTTQKQDRGVNSFIGGIPKLPKNFDLPITKDTGTLMTFFYQYEFPQNHPYSGFTISIFAATDCMHENYTIPEMLKTLYGVDIPKGFLDEYQKYFKVFIYKNGDYPLREEYTPILVFKTLYTTQELDKSNSILFGHISNIPKWYLNDESPATYNTCTRMVFLFQTQIDYVYEKLPIAPRQKVLSFSGDSKTDVEDAYTDKYELFNANEIYFFGTDNTEKKIYIITQC
ncbi:hypothetical protein [Sulfurimonas sp.]|uniref:hypothetical protein n=1 Tax=Sulfurimonas sp. TaxID=2022749 RepID=UPI003D1332E0